MKHLILVGASYLDTILTVPWFPEEDSKLRATSIQVLSSFAPDGRTGFEHCLYREHNTDAASSYIIRSEANGSRTIVNSNGLPEMTLAEFVDIAAQFRDKTDTWWHFEGRIPDTVLGCMHHLRHTMPHAKISVEVEKPNRDGLRELAAEADVVFYSRTWAETNGYKHAEACLAGETCPKAFLMLCTWGTDGAAAMSAPNKKHWQYKGRPAARVVDSVGAGDTFIAGILYRLLCDAQHERDIGASLRFAVDLAGRKVQIEGFDLSSPEEQ